MKILNFELEKAKMCVDVCAINCVYFEKETGHVQIELDNGAVRTIVASSIDEGASIYQDILLAMKELGYIKYSPSIQSTTNHPMLYSNGSTGAPIDWDVINKNYELRVKWA